MKKVFFALFAVVIAVSGSAFTNAKATGTVYGNEDGNFISTNTTSYSTAKCDPKPAELPCAYRVTATGQTIVTASSYTDLQMSAFLSAGYIEVHPQASNGLYLID